VPDELCWLPVREQAELVRTKDVSSTELVTAHLHRIGRLNPVLNAIVTLDEERSLREAAEADAAVARGDELGPLHGVPALFKDTHDTAGMRTTYGSPLFAEHVPDTDALSVSRIRKAGAVTLGKTNVPEFAAGSHTFNPVFGATRNPYDTSRTPGGSSGGAAAALAAGLAGIAEGGDMGGSLRNPAAFCNVVGLRPSPGRVPEVPADFGWQSLSVSGPLGRTVDDVALQLSVISGPDPRNPISIEQDGRGFAELRPAEPAGLRVAWSPDLGGRVDVDDEVRRVLAGQPDLLAGLGCAVTEDCPDFAGADESFRTLRAWMFAHSLGGHLREHPGSLKATLVWNIEQGQALSGADVATAVQQQTDLHLRAAAFFGDYDILALPVTQVVPFDLTIEYPTVVGGREQHTYLDWMRSAYYVTMTGCPAISVPAGFTPEGLPVGIQFVAAHRAEAKLLEFALAYEAATRVADRHPVFG
jgi:amidase